MFIRSELKDQAKQILRNSFVLPFLITLAGMFLMGGLFSIDVNVDNGYYATLTIMQTYKIDINYYKIAGWMLVIGIFSALWGFFVANPTRIGVARFFLKNTDHEAAAEELIHPFKNNYTDSVKIMFFCNLQILLYSLLLIIPGIIKSIQLSFVPYLINEYPHLSRDEIMNMSCEMTNGLKWEIFVLDFSFFFWLLAAAFLAPFTLGLSNVAVETYINQTTAFLYVWVKENRPYLADNSENYFN